MHTKRKKPLAESVGDLERWTQVSNLKAQEESVCELLMQEILNLPRSCRINEAVEDLESKPRKRHKSVEVLEDLERKNNRRIKL